VIVARHVSHHQRGLDYIAELGVTIECIGEIPEYDLFSARELFDDTYLREWVESRYGPVPVLSPVGVRS